MGKSKIEWTDEVWNPVVGCKKVSKGCQHCYAEKMAKRLAAMGQIPYQKVVTEINANGRWTGHAEYLPERLEDPLKWKKPRRVFVNSMSDLFHEDVPLWFINQVFWTMIKASWHTYIILTKRPERMHHELINFATQPNVWLGVSVEDQQTADERIPWLLKTPAAVRFVSVEPMLGAVDLMGFLPLAQSDIHGVVYSPVGGPFIDWVICGGESGPGARPMHPDWARSLRDQCRGANVPFFFKQWGEWIAEGQYAAIDGTWKPTTPDKQFADGTFVFRIGKKAAGRKLDGEEWDGFPVRHDLAPCGGHGDDEPCDAGCVVEG